jgi:hypothetical protein
MDQERGGIFITTISGGTKLGDDRGRGAGFEEASLFFGQPIITPPSVAGWGGVVFHAQSCIGHWRG